MSFLSRNSAMPGALKLWLIDAAVRQEMHRRSSPCSRADLRKKPRQAAECGHQRFPISLITLLK